MLRCPRCSRAGDDPSDGCIDKQTMPCPSMVPVMPGKDVVLVCREDGCGKVFALPATSILHRTIPTEISCMRSPCGAVSIKPKPHAPSQEG